MIRISMAGCNSSKRALRGVMPLNRCSVAKADWAMRRAMGNTAL